MNNRVVVITGATGGLGEITTRAFAEQGESLALISSNQNKLDVLARELNLPGDRILTHPANLPCRISNNQCIRLYFFCHYSAGSDE